MPLDPLVASGLISAVDTRFKQLSRTQPSYAYGVVATRDMANHKVSVYLSGDATASEGFIFSDRSVPVIGDRVRVVIDPRGDRYVDEVFSRHDEILIGADTHIEEYSGGLGIVTNAHAAQALMAKGILLSNSYADPDPATSGIQFGADVSLARSGINVIATGAGDYIDATLAGQQVVKTSTMSIANNVWTRVTNFTLHDWTPHRSTWNPYGGSEIRFDVAGLWLIVLKAAFAGNAGGNRRIISASWGASATPTPTPQSDDENTYFMAGFSSDLHMQAVYIRNAAVNQTVALTVHQNSGGNLNIVDARMSIAYLGRGT